MDYVMTYDIDRNDYYPYGNLAIADFPVSKEIFTKEHTLYLGMRAITFSTEMLWMFL